MTFVVFAGQSNIGGAFMDASTLPAAWRPDPLTLIWDASQKAWTQMRPGVNTGYGQQPSAWGPEVGFAIAFRARFPDEVLRIVKVAHGGASLEPNHGAWIYDWSPESRGEWFDQTSSAITEAAAAAGERPRVVFWGQGEQDARDLATAQAYASNLAELFTAIRAEWLGDPNGRIGYFQINTATQYAGQVRQAQVQVDLADPFAVSFDSEPYPRQADQLHFSAAGYEAIGLEFFQLFAGWTVPGQSRVGTAGADTLFGGDGHDTLNGGEGADFVRGGLGDDRIHGGDQFDDLHGNQGHDTINGGRGPDWVVGGQGNDLLFGDEDHDVVLGNLGDDTCHGGTGNDVIRGGKQNDRLFGEDGDDWLSGDRGDDTVTGGAGADTFHTFIDAGLDVVTDFNAAEGDRVYLLPGTRFTLRQEGPDTVVDMGAGGRMVLQNVQMSSLPDGWIFGF